MASRDESTAPPWAGRELTTVETHSVPLVYLVGGIGRRRQGSRAILAGKQDLSMSGESTLCATLLGLYEMGV